MRLELSDNPAQNMVGDSKLPNRYWVTATTDFDQLWHSERDKCYYTDYAEALMEKHEIESKITHEAVFSTFREALQFVAGLCIPPEPTQEGPNKAMIEDRFTGTLYERRLLAKKGEWGYTFELEDIDDTSYTKKRMAELGATFE